MILAEMFDRESLINGGMWENKIPEDDGMKQAQRILQEQGVENHLMKKQNLFLQGSPSFGVYLVKKGHIQVSHIGTEGDETTFRIFLPGEIVCPSYIFDNKDYNVTATALSDSEVVFVRREKIISLMKQHSEMNSYVMNSLMENIRYMEVKYLQQTNRKASQRLASALLELTQSNDHSVTNNKLSLNRKQISSLIGASQETIIRLMSKLKNDAIVEEKNGELRILNPRKLVSLASS